MKRRKLDKKLTLSKETLKSLDTHDVERVAGGAGGGTNDPGPTLGRCWTQVFSVCLC
jgi:hypothetical protein